MTAEVNGERLTEEEVIANSIADDRRRLKTTTNLIGNGMLTLLRGTRNALCELREEPGDDSERRWRNCFVTRVRVSYTARLAPADVMLGGKQIKKRQAVIAVMAAGNRDPERFPDPDRLDLARADNRHLAFGWAAHFCFGAPLARMEGQIAFATLLERLPELELAHGVRSSGARIWGCAG